METKKYFSVIILFICLTLMVVGNTDKGNQIKKILCEELHITKYDFELDIDSRTKADITSKGVMVHDPSIIKDKDQYYIFGSHMTAAKSHDLLTWEKLASGYDNTNPVYGQIFDVSEKAFEYSGSRDSVISTDDKMIHVWAPDVIYNKDTEKYYMYYCTTSTWNASNLCFGISETVEGPYEWQGAFIYSGYNMDTIGTTDVLDYVDADYAKKNYIQLGEYNFKDYPNAIDPTIFYDKDDKLWMVYGSWSGGIFLLELDKNTGYPIHPDANLGGNIDTYYGKRLLGGGHISIEGPYIIYDKESDYYYLFVSYGSLTSKGGYQIRVFRSKTVDGEYVDMNGFYPTKGIRHQNYGLKMSGNYLLPSIEKAYMATGHNSAFINDDGKRYIVYHTRFDDNRELHSPRVRQYLLNKEGWPCGLPYQTQGETVSPDGYDRSEVMGRYYVVNQGTEIDADIATPIVLYLEKNGKVVGEEATGQWQAVEGSYYMNITIGDTEFSGVFCQMLDEAGNEVMTFSAVGNNETLWGVKYLE